MKGELSFVLVSLSILIYSHKMVHTRKARVLGIPFCTTLLRSFSISNILIEGSRASSFRLFILWNPDSKPSITHESVSVHVDPLETAPIPSSEFV